MSSLPDPSVLEQKIRFDLQDRGVAIALYIDLYDEGQYGADQLSWRGRFNDISKLESALSDVMGLGNPIAEDNSNNLCLNRFNSPFARYWTEPELGNPYPRLAQYAVHYRLRVKFNGDVVTIDFGKRWPAYRPIEGVRHADWPIVNECELSLNDDFLTLPQNLEILHTCGISYTDAAIILNAIGLNIDINGPGNNEQDDAPLTEAEEAEIKESIKNDGVISDALLKKVEKSLKPEEKLAKVGDDYLHYNTELVTYITEE